ncbi:50S ribosomal protein L17 [Candidatus Parcubacteria bacterium]|nr:MAG: 50S ribosomal protein L17 [Candidatus Parcubacteria bacterium]
MRHRKTTKTLGRSKSAREALLRDLATGIVVYEKITTTEGRAKAVRPIVEKLITKAKAGDLAARRQLLAFFTTEQPVNKLMEVIGPRYKNRNGGYTRLIKLGYRQGDGAPVVQIELV